MTLDQWISDLAKRVGGPSELARRMGVQASTVSAWAHRAVVPDLWRIPTFAEVSGESEEVLRPIFWEALLAHQQATRERRKRWQHGARALPALLAGLVVGLGSPVAAGATPGGPPVKPPQPVVTASGHSLAYQTRRRHRLGVRAS
jgi:DNA-binding transcriptional regulator YdaS (Cro superfamily)